MAPDALKFIIQAVGNSPMQCLIDTISEMRPLLLDENKAFDLIPFLRSRQMEVTN